MIRTFILGFALSTGIAVIHSAPAYAQSTDQTDQSEEDWRKSKKKKTTTEIFEDIIDIRDTGWGGSDRPLTPMETLPEDSRRHLQKERAKILANADMGGQDEIKSIADAGYNPSEEAKSDPDLAEQEKEAWDVILTDLKGGSGQGGQPQDSGPNKVAVVGQGGGQGSQGQRGNSTMRGGSSQSVADILAQIKGLKSAGGGGSSQGTGQSQIQGPIGSGGQGQQQGQGNGQATQQGQGSQGQGSQAGQSSGQGQSPSQQQGSPGQQGQGQTGQSQQPAQNPGQGEQQSDQGQSQSQSQEQQQSGQQAEGQSQSNASASSESKAAAKAQVDAQTQVETQTPRETISPLDRIKNSRESESPGSRTSASDYLNTGNKLE